MDFNGSLNVCICTTRVPGVPRSQKRTYDPVELELKMVLNLHVGVGKQTWFPQEQQVVLPAEPSPQHRKPEIKSY